VIVAELPPVVGPFCPAATGSVLACAKKDTMGASNENAVAIVPAIVAIVTPTNVDFDLADGVACEHATVETDVHAVVVQTSDMTAAAVGV
jgi:hypothetical protein